MSKSIESLRNRSEAKLNYASVHLEELKVHGTLGGDDFERAHHESFLFHLLGVIDAFLAEVNFHYSAGLDDHDLSIGKLRNALQRQEITCQALKLLYELGQDKASWYSEAKAMRDHVAHIKAPPRRMLVGGEDESVQLRSPITGELHQSSSVELFESWLASMRALLSQMRTSLAP